MPFRARNLYYLRISTKDVLPLYLYLDDRHIEWMSDRVLQHVLADLRPLILPKLRADAHVESSANGKRGAVEVHRGDFYQFAFFFRGAEPHAVILKTRNFTIAPNPPKEQSVSPPSQNVPRQKRKGGRKKQNTSSAPPQKKRKTKGKGRAKTRDIDAEEMAISSGSEVEEDTGVNAADPDTTAPRRSTRARKIVAGAYQDGSEDDDDTANTPEVEMRNDPIAEPAVKEEAEDAVPATPAPDTDEATLPTTSKTTRVVIDIPDDEEKKPKPQLQLKYQGFNIHGRCLCIVVEPWPPIRSASRAPSLAPLGSLALRAPSIAPPDFIPSTGLRERTPLFLPEDDRGRSLTPAPFLHRRILPPVPAFDDPPVDDIDEAEDDDLNENGLMQFSQALNSAGDLLGGEADDDDLDGAVFFGDADETKEL